MDSVKVLLETLAEREPSAWELLLDFLIHVMPLAVAIFVPFITLRYTRQLKELDLIDAHKERKFQIQRVVSEKAVTVMARSYHLTHRLNVALSNYTGAKSKGSIEPELKKDLIEARLYWEEHLFYLPLPIRRQIIPLTNLIGMAMQPTGDDMVRDAFKRVLQMITSLEVAFANLMKEYNLFNDLGNSK